MTDLLLGSKSSPNAAHVGATHLEHLSQFAEGHRRVTNDRDVSAGQMTHLFGWLGASITPRRKGFIEGHRLRLKSSSYLCGVGLGDSEPLTYLGQGLGTSPNSQDVVTCQAAPSSRTILVDKPMFGGGFQLHMQNVDAQLLFTQMMNVKSSVNRAIGRFPCNSMGRTTATLFLPIGTVTRPLPDMARRLVTAVFSSPVGGYGLSPFRRWHPSTWACSSGYTNSGGECQCR